MQTLELEKPRFAGGSSVAFERALETAKRHSAGLRLSPLIAQWEVLITLFKHGFEIPRLIDVEGAPSQLEHRSTLTNLMGMGELIWNQSNEGSEELLLETGYDKGFLSSNLRYLRSKYQEWYGIKDEEQIKQDIKTMTDALSRPA